MNSENVGHSDLEQKINFLSDKPLAADYAQNDRFGHSGIAENLKKIILSCPVPFTIGLFGKWGTGKTSILNILSDKLSTEKVPVVKFDVWKHEGDALRRTFLTELVKQLKDKSFLKKNFELADRVTCTIQIDTLLKKTDKLSFSLITILIGVIITLGFVLYKIDHVLGQAFFTSLSGSSMLGVLLIFIFQNMLITRKETTTLDRFQDPGQFEDEFLNVIKNVRTSTGRVLIAIDNLDRCTHQKAIELLATIKTFLSKDEISPDANKCVFLIPCDDKAIKKHLEAIYGKNDSKDYDTDEFLRKFFNASITIPDFIDTELQWYTGSLLKETQITEFQSTDLAFVIATAFCENPRQIKQFINILISHFLLAKTRENGDSPVIVPSGIITKNVEFLAKFLVIRQKFPKEYEKITREYLQPEKWGEIESANVDFVRYHTATNMFVVNDIRPFIFLKQSKEEIQIPGLHQIERGFLENNAGFVEDNLKNIIVESQQFHHFNDSLLHLIRRHKSIKTSLINIVRCILTVSSNLKIVFTDSVYKEIVHILCNPECLKYRIYEFSPSLIFVIILFRCKQTQRDVIINEYVSYLRNPNSTGKDTVIMQEGVTKQIYIGRDLAHEITKEFLKKLEWLTQSQKANIKQSIEDLYASDGKYISLFQDNVNAQKDFISDNTLSKFISSPSTDFDIKISFTTRMQLLLKFGEVIGAKSIVSTFTTFMNIFKSSTEQKEILLNQIGLMLSAFPKYIGDDNIRNESNALAEQLYQSAVNVPNINNRKTYILPFYILINAYQVSNKGKLLPMVKEFFENANVESVLYVIEKSEGQKTSLIDQYQDVLMKKSINDDSVFDHLYPFASEQTQPVLLKYMIENSPQNGVKKLKAIDYKTSDDKSIVHSLLNKASNHPNMEQKLELYASINKMKCAGDNTLINKYAEQIKLLLTQPDQSKQEVGYKTFNEACMYLPELIKRDISTAVIDWLRNPQTTDSYQPNSIRTVILSWDIIPQPARDGYVYFLFHNLIMPKNKLDAIRLAFEILSKINLTIDLAYENELKIYFGDALNAAKNESRKEYKAVIISGLLSLRPQKPNKETAEFFDRVAKEQN